MSARNGGAHVVQLEHGEALEPAPRAPPSGDLASTVGGWLLPATEQYAAARAAPHAARTYRSTLRSIALSVQTELGLLPTIDALAFFALPHARAPYAGGGIRLSAVGVGEVAARYLRGAAVPEDRRTAHTLRHTFCTAVATRSNLEVVQRLAGHADISTPARYVDVTESRATTAITDAFDTGSFDSR